MTMWPVRDGAIAASVALVAVIIAQGGGAASDMTQNEWPGRDGKQGARSQDLAFAARASEAMATEIQMARLALTRAESSKVREFAQQALVDHSRVRRDLAKITSPSGDQTIASLPPLRGDRAAMERLRAATREEFDRLYVSLRLAATETAVRRFDSEAHRGRDPDLARFARMTLPLLDEQLKVVQTIADESLPSTRLAGEPH